MKINLYYINLLALHLWSRSLFFSVAYFPTATNSFITTFPNNSPATKKAATSPVSRSITATTTTTTITTSSSTTTSVVAAAVGVPIEEETLVKNDDDDTTDNNKSSSFFSNVLSKEENNMNRQIFFEEIWQQKPYLFRANNPNNQQESSSTKDEEGWNALLDMLQYTSFKDESEFIADPPQFLKYSQPMHPHEIHTLYEHNLFATYLDGCSSIQNHADLLSPYIAQLCQNFQFDFPNVYANTYLTPPNSQTFKPHADDRDVFVVQLVGSKNWLVYNNVPIQLPYDHEQVGKYGNEVPTEVLTGQRSIDTNIEVGDILYIPRGHVHEARCSVDDLSFHVTIAVPTFDWTMAGMMSQATQSILARNVDLRKSMLPLSGGGSNLDNGQQQQQQREYVQKQIDIAIDLLKKQVTVDAVLNNLYTKVDRHKQRSTPIRQNQIQQLTERSNPTINLSTQIRWTTGTTTTTTGEEQQQEQQPILLRSDVVEPLQSIQSKLIIEDDDDEGGSSSSKVYRISELRALIDDDITNKSMVCDLTLVSWVIQCIRHGHMEIVN